MSVGYDYLTFQKKEKTACIELTARIKEPGAMPAFVSELSGVCADIRWDKEIRVILIYNDAEDVLAMDAEWLRAWAKESQPWDKDLFSITKPIMGLDQPVIAGINGDAMGPGLELTLACDLRISSNRSRFGLPYLAQGLIPWDGGTQLLSRLVGKGKAMEMILTEQVIDAHEAYRIGLVNKVVSETELKSFLFELAGEMASKAPLSLAYAKEAIIKGMDLSLEQGLRLEADLYFLMHTLRDRTEGITAFLEKRRPRFQGE